MGSEYFMRSAQFYAIAIFVTGRLCPPSRGGVYPHPPSATVTYSLGEAGSQ